MMTFRERRRSLSLAFSPPYALQAANSPIKSLLFLGAGEAATGIADWWSPPCRRKAYRRPMRVARNWLADLRGLVVKQRSELAEHKLPYAHEHAPISDFVTAIRTLKPTAIIGVAAVGGTFTPEVLQAMAELNQRPIVFALSNPTSKAECSAEEAYRHTGGRALFACGSPYDPVTLLADLCAAAGQQLLYFPRRGAGRGREWSAAHHRRNVHGCGAHARAARHRSRPRAGQPLSGSATYPRSLGPHRC